MPSSIRMKSISSKKRMFATTYEKLKPDRWKIENLAYFSLIERRGGRFGQRRYGWWIRMCFRIEQTTEEIDHDDQVQHRRIRTDARTRQWPPIIRNEQSKKRSAQWTPTRINRTDRQLAWSHLVPQSVAAGSDAHHHEMYGWSEYLCLGQSIQPLETIDQFNSGLETIHSNALASISIIRWW